MNDTHDIEATLSATTPTLSASEKASLWTAIDTAITPVPSPYFTHTKRIAITTLALILIVGMGGTAYASEGARPGDFLFPIDRALEEAELALTRNETAQAELHLRIAEERVNELRSLLEERKHINDTTPSASSTATTTVVDDTRVSESLSLINAVLPKLSDDKKARIFAEVRAEMGVQDHDSESGEREDKEERHENREFTTPHTEERLEIRSDVGRIKVRTKDSETRVEIKTSSSNDSTHSGKDEDDDDKEDHETDREEDRSRSDDSPSEHESTDEETSSTNESPEREEGVRIEARVENGVAEVKVEANGTRTEFTTPFTTRTALITTIALRTGLLETSVSGSLNLEIKD